MDGGESSMGWEQGVSGHEGMAILGLGINEYRNWYTVLC